MKGESESQKEWIGFAADLLTPQTFFLPHSGEYPTLADWTNHLTTIFPEVSAVQMKSQISNEVSWHIF